MIELDEERIFVNKTSRFLLPCLRGYGEDFVKRFNSFYKYAVGISDSYWYGVTKDRGRYIFILCNTGKNIYQIHNFLHWIKKKPFFVESYCPDAAIKTSNKLMIVLEIPERFNNAYDMFVQGKFSQMFTEEEKELLFLDKNLESYQILSRSIDYMESFVNKLNSEFETSIKVKDFDEIPPEMEIPLKSVEEIFNSSKEYFLSSEEDVWEEKGDV